MSGYSSPSTYSNTYVKHIFRCFAKFHGHDKHYRLQTLWHLSGLNCLTFCCSTYILQVHFSETCQTHAKYAILQFKHSKCQLFKSWGSTTCVKTVYITTHKPYSRLFVICFLCCIKHLVLLHIFIDKPLLLIKYICLWLSNMSSSL